jgi:hypothetical protein
MRKIKLDCGWTCQFPSDGGCASFWLTANPEVILRVVPGKVSFSVSCHSLLVNR